jgi:hypothetical protein
MSLTVSLHRPARMKSFVRDNRGWLTIISEDGGEVTVFMPIPIADAIVDVWESRAEIIDAAERAVHPEHYAHELMDEEVGL